MRIANFAMGGALVALFATLLVYFGMIEQDDDRYFSPIHSRVAQSSVVLPDLASSPIHLRQGKASFHANGAERGASSNGFIQMTSYGARLTRHDARGERVRHIAVVSASHVGGSSILYHLLLFRESGHKAEFIVGQSIGADIEILSVRFHEKDVGTQSRILTGLQVEYAARTSGAPRADPRTERQSLTLVMDDAGNVESVVVTTPSR